MRRADRLFRIVEFLKARRTPVTAENLALELEVSVRTIYRDIADLSASGVPILGEAGVGYVLDKNYTMRPMTFDVEELDAMTLGVRMVANWGDDAIARAAARALDKIRTVLPREIRDTVEDTALFSPPGQAKLPITIDFTGLRRAIRARRKVRFTYDSLAGARTTRTVRPLCLLFFGPEWLFTGWCELREDFRNFRLDLMSDLVVLEELFVDEPGRRLADYRECADHYRASGSANGRRS